MITEYVKSWFQRADDDLKLIEIVFKERENFLPNPLCFHAQQAAEKYFKGFLAYHDLHTRKIHDLEVLVADCVKVDKLFEELREPARFLNQFYLESRYPDDYVRFSVEDAKEAYKAALKIKEFVLEKIKF
jgi:HEPN domain-containing protein